MNKTRLKNLQEGKMLEIKLMRDNFAIMFKQLKRDFQNKFLELLNESHPGVFQGITLPLFRAF